jgi:acyl-coenzyme A synthetase/AMP-(fatty) acid ligase
LWQMNRSGALSPKRTLQFAAIGFDVAFQEVFLTLCAGGALVLIDERKKRNFKDLVQVVNTNGVERLFLPYIALQMLAESLNEMDSFHPVEHFGRALSEVVTAGEQLRVDARISAMFERLRHCTLENQYGPTETHVVTSFVLPRDIACWTTLPPIGRPIANTRIYILDKNLDPAPAGVVGEMYIAGAGLARDYLSRAELTAERFVGDPFTVGGERMYKTGDQGRWLADGTIEFLGRNDFQVKIRGFRIELGEIEARLAEHPGVAEAVVVARDDGAGERRLVAYYTAAATGEEHQDESMDAIGNQQLRSHLSAILPEYMVPMAYVRLDRMPLTPNGKLDRRALPAPKGDAYGVRSYEAPVGETESVLATIWAELLKVERVGRWDNFFELGGHSLLAVRMVSRIQQVLGVEVAIGELFANPAVAPFADRITSLQIEQFDPEEIADLLNQIRNS